jgi:predicted nucleic acid-binding protein
LLVVDASVLVSYLSGGEHSTWSRECLTAGERQGGLGAPYLIDAEVGHALRREVMIGELNSRSAGAAVDDLSEMPLQRVPHLGLLGRAWSLRHNLSFYDALYVALAEQLHAPLLTLDARLGRAPGVKAEVWSPA